MWTATFCACRVDPGGWRGRRGEVNDHSITTPQAIPTLDGLLFVMRGRRCCRRPRLCVLVGVLRVPPSLIESGKGKIVRTKFTPPSQASRNFIHCRPRPQQPHHHPPTTSTCTGAYLCVITQVAVPKSQLPHQRPGRPRRRFAPCPAAERRPPAPMKLHPLHHAMLVQVPCSLFVLYVRPQYSSRAQRNTKTGPAALVQARPPTS